MTKNQIQENLSLVQNKIKLSAKKFKRDDENINLIAVSKRQPLARVQAMLECGHRIFGENIVQDAIKTWAPLKPEHPDLKLHLIGPLQSNKTADAVKLFDVIETIDRPKLIKAVVKEMKVQNKKIECFIQVNTGEEKQKSGVLPQELSALLQYAQDEGLEISGLMCIPPFDEPAALHFAFLKKLADAHDLKNISMGMSSDYERAIALGATHVRVGSSLFGAREQI